MLNNTIFPDIFSKIIHIPTDTIQYFIDLKKAHNKIEKEAIANEFGKNQQILIDMKQKAIDIIQYHQKHQYKLDNIFKKLELEQLSKIQIPLFDRFLCNSLNQLNLKDLKFTVYQNQKLLDEYDVWFKKWQKNNEIATLLITTNPIFSKSMFDFSDVLKINKLIQVVKNN